MFTDTSYGRHSSTLSSLRVKSICFFAKIGCYLEEELSLARGLIQSNVKQFCSLQPMWAEIKGLFCAAAGFGKELACSSQS